VVSSLEALWSCRALNQLFSYSLSTGLALPLGMTKDPASGVIKPSLSAEGRTLLRTLGADRSKMTRCLRVEPRLLRSRESARDSGERPSLGRSLRCASSTLSPSSSRLVIPEGKCNPSRNVWRKFVGSSETCHRAREVANRDRLDC